MLKRETNNYFHDISTQDALMQNRFRLLNTHLLSNGHIQWSIVLYDTLPDTHINRTLTSSSGRSPGTVSQVIVHLRPEQMPACSTLMIPMPGMLVCSNACMSSALMLAGTSVT